MSHWSAPKDVRELIALSGDSALWPWQPQVRYYLLDMRAFPGEKLARRAGLATLLFRFERQPSKEELKELIDAVLRWVRQHPGYAELRQLFTELVRRAYTGLGMPGPIPEDLQVFRSNLDTLGEVWKQEWKAEALAEGRSEGRREGRREGHIEGHSEGRRKGHIEGLVEGRVEGRIEGRADALLDLLAERFGAVKPPLLERIRKADLATLERWFKHAIVAPDLLSVFA